MPVRTGEPVAAEPPPVRSSPAPSPNPLPAPNELIRPAAPAPADEGGLVMVPMRRLDELVRLVGETATAQLRLGHLLKERFAVDPTALVEFNDMSRSVNDLQDRTMRTRMVPVATITDQLHRAVRDLARARARTSAGRYAAATRNSIVAC